MALDLAYRENFRWKCLIVDDAGVAWSKFLPLRDRSAADYFMKMIHVVRRYAASLIITTPTPKDLMKTLRNQTDWIRVEVREVQRFPVKVSRVNITAIRLDPLGNEYPVPIAENLLFTVRLPNSVFYKYRRIQREYEKLIRELEARGR